MCSLGCIEEYVVAGMETATSAAAAGGITTVIDMPLNSDPTTTTVELLQKKISATRVSHLSRTKSFWDLAGDGLPHKVPKADRTCADETLTSAGYSGILGIH